MQQLQIDRQHQVLKFIEFLIFYLGDRQESENLTAKKTGDSPRDLLRKWEGAVEGGVDDLSYNKKYMEGYGQK